MSEDEWDDEGFAQEAAAVVMANLYNKQHDRELSPPRRIRVYAVAKPGEEPIAVGLDENDAWVKAEDWARDARFSERGYRLIPGWLELEEGV